LFATVAATPAHAERYFTAPNAPDGWVLNGGLDGRGVFGSPREALEAFHPTPLCDWYQGEYGCVLLDHIEVSPNYTHVLDGYFKRTWSYLQPQPWISKDWSVIPLLTCPTGFKLSETQPGWRGRQLNYVSPPLQKYNSVAPLGLSETPRFYPICYRDSNSNAEPPNPNRTPGESCSQGAKSSKDTPRTGNPCNAATGNKYETETDYAGAGAMRFERYYNSVSVPGAAFGLQWRGTYDRRVAERSATSGKRYEYPDNETMQLLNMQIPMFASVALERPDGKTFWFTQFSGGPWKSEPDIDGTLAKTESGWTYSTRDGTVESYDVSGRLVSITDRAGLAEALTYNGSGQLTQVTHTFGNRLSFTYEAAGRVSSLTDPAGRIVSYSYDAAGNLARVDYPDGTAKLYHYEDANLPHHMTGISHVDSSGIASRYSIFSYDGQGRAISTEHAGGIERFTLSYDYYPLRTTVTDAAGTREQLNFINRSGAMVLTTRQNMTDNKLIELQYDSIGNATCRADEDRRTTEFTYTATNQLASKKEGLMRGGACGSAYYNTPPRTTTYQYLSPTRDLPTVIESTGVYAGGTKRITIDYTNNLPTTITQSGFTPTGAAVSRSITLGYNAYGQVTSIDGPRTDVADVTTLAYYECSSGGACGQLRSISNARGHTTTFDSYDGAGRVTQMTDPNGLRTSYDYDARGRVRFITQTSASGARVTEYRYTAAGDVAYVALPDGRALTYEYDAARLLRAVTDNLGNRIAYGYDLRGNRTTEYTYDSGGTLARQVDLAYDLRNHVSQINNGGSITKQVWDGVGNLTKVTDPNTVATNGYAATNHSYDTLNRITQTVNTLYGYTYYSYDINNNIAQVKAPNNATTTYIYDDLGNLLQETSPDRGTTTYSYDNAGNVLTKTDARGVSVAYRYDALNRITAVDYAGSGEDVGHSYDGCLGGVGRVCTITDAAGTTSYDYDAFGNVATQIRSEAGYAYTTRYAYDAGNRVVSIAYPDGRVAQYTRNPIGQIVDVSVTVNTASTTLVSARNYRGDGLLASQIFGNGLSDIRQYDLQGRLLNQFVGSADTRVYGYDANGNLTSKQTLPEVATYTYDALDRLQTGQGNLGSGTYAYDANGNRTSGVIQGPPPAPGAAPPNDWSLLGAYDFEGNLNDTSTYARHGSPVGTIGYLSGISGQALRLPGVNSQYVDLGAMDEIEGANAYTISAWVKMRSLNGYQHVLGKATYWAAGDVGWHCYSTSCGVYVGAGNAVTASLAGETNRWHYWTSVYDNGTLKFYLDGALVGQRTVSGVPGTNAYTFKLGTDNEATYPAAADIDQLRIYKRGLASSEISPLVIPGSSGSSGGTYTYASASNRMTSAPGATISLDVAGNTLANGTLVFAYNNAGQLATAGGGGFGGASYGYNAQSLRTQKTIGSSVTVYHYDLQGRLIAESRGDSTPIRAYVWDDTQPIAQIEYAPGNEKLYYLHTDHLATTRLATDSAQRVVWRYEGEAFGASVPNEDPDGDGVKVTINLRFPGQYYDAETGLHYNWNRYYDPKLGRYITSDPIGLTGGINTYVYVRNNPARFTDPTGLICYWNQDSGDFLCVDPAGRVYLDSMRDCQYQAYSGAWPLGVNNGDRQHQVNVGPIPRGDWQVITGPVKIKVGKDFIYDALQIVPLPGNDVWQTARDPLSFFIHGANDYSMPKESKGCPIVEPKCRARIPFGETIRVY
jgi:RHS repeat-associated protein